MPGMFLTFAEFCIVMGYAVGSSALIMLAAIAAYNIYKYGFGLLKT